MQEKRGDLLISHVGHFILNKVPEAHVISQPGNNFGAYIVCEVAGDGAGSGSRCCRGQGEGRTCSPTMCLYAALPMPVCGDSSILKPTEADVKPLPQWAR